MDLTPFVDNLRRELAVAADAGGEEARALAERLTAPLESAARLTLLNALTAAAEEITRDLAPGSVDVRLRGLSPDFVVTAPGSDQPSGDEPDGPAAPGGPPSAEPGASPHAGTAAEDGPTSRINFRLPEQLKLRVEEAAAREGLSVNAWLTRAVATTLRGDEHASRSRKRDRWGGQRYTGWVR
ncbi:toxin-antitoxin system HicB family antitoxin [Saccharopolyspora erythraea]|uniref:toxin-antitoxin system HicB family antitoxin n=1 Tax=Saccharopolyspora erythraea TaxID=1836 RepID=UPI001BA49C66|nr:toxin-antitoxin system HicB family antitoxin [Saccharopolyspora erythraea]QUH03253.1 toxin-antitoxin system HicB family antitoxin [Saccharopolyspora erythraea]